MAVVVEHDKRRKKILEKSLDLFIEVGYEDVTADWIIRELKNGEHIGMDEPEKLLQYQDAVLVFMSSKDIYVLANKYKEIA